MTIKDIYPEEEAWKNDLERRFTEFDKKLRNAQRDGREEIVSMVAEQAGVDLNSIIKDIEHRDRSQKIAVHRFLKEVEKEHLKQLPEARKRFDEVSENYNKIFGEAYQKHIHNPMFVSQAIEADYSELIDPEPEEEHPFATTEYDFDDDGRPISMHPEVQSSNEHDCFPTTARVMHHILYEHVAPAGDFVFVNTMTVSAGGLGTIYGWRGKSCWGCDRDSARGVAVNIRVRVQQAPLTWQTVLDWTPVYQRTQRGDDAPFRRSDPYWNVISVNRFLNFTPVVGGFPLMLLGEDRGGERFQVLVDVEVRADTVLRNEFHSILFGRVGGCKLNVPGIMMFTDLIIFEEVSK